MALVQDSDGSYIWCPHMMAMDEYRQYIHCANRNGFYFIRNNEIFCIDHEGTESKMRTSNIGWLCTNKMMLYQENLILIELNGVFYDDSVYFDIWSTFGIEILKICKSYMIYKLRGKWKIKSRREMKLLDTEDAVCMWCDSGALYKYDGKNIWLLQLKSGEFKACRMIENTRYTIKHVGTYTVISHKNVKVILHPDGSIALLSNRYHDGEIIEIKSDERTILITDENGGKHLYPRDTMHHMDPVEGSECICPRQLKSARKI